MSSSGSHRPHRPPVRLGSPARGHRMKPSSPLLAKRSGSLGSGSQSRMSAATLGLSIVGGTQLRQTQASAGPRHPHASRYVLDKDADITKGLEVTQTVYSRRSPRSKGGRGPASPLAVGVPQSLEAGGRRSPASPAHPARNPLHSDNSPIVISSLCYSKSTQAAMRSASRGAQRETNGGSVKALFKAYQHSPDTAIHRKAVVAQAKARAARKLRVSPQRKTVGPSAI